MAKLSLFDRRRRRVRTALKARASGKPRLSVHRSGRHIYAQVIDDAAGKTLASASSLDKDLRSDAGGATATAAATVGKTLAERAKQAGVSRVVQILRTELEMAMALTGRTSIAAIDRTVLWS